MKKLLLGSATLTIFALAIIIFQISCQKEAKAQTGSNYTLPAATTSSLGGVIIGSGLTVNSSGVLSANTATAGGLSQLNLMIYQVNDNNVIELWTANTDGTNQQKIPITLPTGLTIDGDVRLTPDGKKIIFTVDAASSIGAYIYSCTLDGKNLTRIVDNPTMKLKFFLGGVY